MDVLRHLRKPVTIAELRALTGLTHPELTAELRRLGRAVREIKPTTINDRAIRYQRNDDPTPKRDPAPAENRAREDVHGGPDSAPLPVDLAKPCPGDAGENAGDDARCNDDRPSEAWAERASRARGKVGPDAVISAVRQLAATGRPASLDAVTRDARRILGWEPGPDAVMHAISVILKEGCYRRKKRTEAPRIYVWADVAGIPWQRRSEPTVRAMLATMDERGAATPEDLALIVKLCVTRVRIYLRKMHTRGLTEPADREVRTDSAGRPNANTVRWRAIGSL
jgi:hypothetical protein